MCVCVCVFVCACVCVCVCVNVCVWRCWWRNKWIQLSEFRPWTRLLTFYIALIPLWSVWIQLFSLKVKMNSRTDFKLVMTTGLGVGKFCIRNRPGYQCTKQSIWLTLRQPNRVTEKIKIIYKYMSEYLQNEK